MANTRTDRNFIVANAVAPTFTEGDVVYLSCDLNGNVRTTVTGGASGGTSSVDESAFTEAVSSFTPTGGAFNDSLLTLSAGQQAESRITGFRALHVNLRTNAGAEIGTLASPIRNQQVGIANAQIVDSGGNGVTVTGNKLDVNATVTISYSGATGSAVPASASYEGINVGGTLRGRTGVNPTGTVYAAQGDISSIAGTVASVSSGNLDNGTLRVTLATNQVANTNPFLVSLQPPTSGGLSVSSFLSTAAVQATVAKASPGQLFGLHFFNNSATIAYVRFYNQTGAPGVGDTVVWRGLVPANTSGTGHVIEITNGLAFSTGIAYRVTAAVADNDNTSLGANTILGNVLYK